MKRASICLIAALCLWLPTGCLKTTTTTTPVAVLAPGYNSVQDQTFGQAMAALRDFAATQKQQYPQLTPAQQATVKGPLNIFIQAVDFADTVYKAYHAGTSPTPTAAQTQAAITSAQSAQGPLNASLGVK